MSKPQYQFDNAAVRVALGATTAEITSLVVGRVYRVTALGGNALIEVGAADASTSNFYFGLGNGESILWRAQDTTVNVIENDDSSATAAAVVFARVSEEYDG